VNRLTLPSVECGEDGFTLNLEGFIMRILMGFGNIRSQFFHGHKGHLIVDLNCGWYCLTTALEIKFGLGAPNVPHPGLGAWGYDVTTANVTNSQAAPPNCLAWYTLLSTHGPVIVSGKLGGADWGTHLGKKRGVQHYILINGCDTTLDPAGNGRGGRLFYLDPLTGGWGQRHGTFDHMAKRFDSPVHTLK
jgi:hypothetical protein